ncbi:facilitated trehalose transporter Tret1-like [Epargyreus clarus]|uniref:facilitated trehalose transporter Tret1-like n=1 Tax=Epargyreus clarus TaxID=520877 RepID=UPI003C2B87B2
MVIRKYYGVLNEGSKTIQIIFAILINIPIFAYGTCIGWMSPMTLLLQSDKTPTEKPVTDFEISLMASICYLLSIPSDYLMAFLSDRFGRKFCLLFLSVTCAFSWILLLCTVNIHVMIFARTMVGIIMGSGITCPLYTKEISDDTIRGALGCLVVLFQTSGNLFVYIIGDLLEYKTILWVCLSLPVFHILIFMMMPESPSYLVKHGNVEEAQKVIAWLKCRQPEDPIVVQALDHIRKEQKTDEEGSQFLVKDIFMNKILFRAFCITLVVTLGREICGAITVLNFAGEIFSFATNDQKSLLTPNQQAMILGAVQVAGALLASGIVEKAGRKGLLFITSLISGLSMCALASWFLSKEMGIFTLTWLPVVTLCVCIFCDSLGLQPISVVLTSEMFSYKYRGTVLAMTMSTSSILCFVQLFFFKSIATTIGVHVAFYFFGLVCLSAALYVIIVVPETKARSLEEIYEDLKTKKEKEMEQQVETKEKETAKENEVSTV